MGTSTDGQICYGIQFEEGYSFPWLKKEYDNEIGVWWLYKVHGYKDPCQLFDAEGNFVEGRKPSEAVIEAHFTARDKARSEYPLPVVEMNYCSGSSPMYILAIPSSVLCNSRGFPVVFSPAKLQVSTEETAALIAFCRRYCQPREGEEFPAMKPRWYLTSYWG